MKPILISYSSYHLLDEWLAKIIKNENITKYDLEEVDMSTVLEDASYMSLFNDEKYLIIYNANFFSSGSNDEKTIESLLKYLENSNQNSCLIFVLNKNLDERKKIVKYFREHGEVKVLAIDEKDISKKISSIFEENKVNISFSSINYIKEICQNNYDLIMGEINKILIYLDGKKEITPEEVKDIVSPANIIDNFAFSDAVVSRNISLAFSLLDELITLKAEVPMLIGLLASQYRLMASIRACKKKNMSNKEIASFLSVHPYRVEVMDKANYSYTEKEVLDALAFLAKIDEGFKTGEINEYNGLEMFLLSLEV